MKMLLLSSVKHMNSLFLRQRYHNLKESYVSCTLFSSLLSPQTHALVFDPYNHCDSYNLFPSKFLTDLFISLLHDLIFSYALTQKMHFISCSFQVTIHYLGKYTSLCLSLSLCATMRGTQQNSTP